MGAIDRRDFLKAASAISAIVSLGEPAASTGGADVRISTQTYTPVRDYPIRPKRHGGVTLNDSFWKPKVDLNADVTIPVEVRKLAETPRGLSGNVLEAAILSLESKPNAWLQIGRAHV